ncbi:hypothetical protein GCM10020258_53380 [Sphingomonas yabuuchiae]
MTGSAGLASVVGYAGSGKSAMLGVAREAWEREGYTVRGAALSGIAAENLEGGSGIRSRTIASLEHAWGQGREQLGPKDVLVVDEAGMIGSRQMERVLSQARDAGAKVVMVGDPEQLQAIEAGAAFRSVTERHGAAEITEIRRQREDWQRDATRALATGRTGEAIHAYDERGMVRAADTREQARGELVDGWDRARQAEPGKSRIILTHTNAEVQSLNGEARDRLRASGDLGDDVTVKAERGDRQFATGDRIMFLRNERGMGVKNGTLATIERVSPEGMAVKLDDGRQVGFDTKDYADVDHGYAATFHKSQGVTVDRAHVLATPAWTGTAPMSACRGIVTKCSSTTVATTSPISASSSAPCRVIGARTWRATMPGPSRTRPARSPIGARSGSRNARAKWPRRSATRRGACSTASGRSRQPRRRCRRSVSRPIDR